jgi:hypothetical protein
MQKNEITPHISSSKKSAVLIEPPRDKAEIFIIDLSEIGITTEIPDFVRNKFRKFLISLYGLLTEGSEYARQLNRVFNTIYDSYIHFYRKIPIESFGIGTNKSASPRSLFLSPERLEENLDYIEKNAKEGDLIRIIDPLHRTDFVIYVSNETRGLILVYMSELEDGYILPGIAINHLARYNLGTYDKIKKEYQGVPIIGIKVPSDPSSLGNWKKAAIPYYLENIDDRNYVRYKNFKIYIGEEIVPEDEEFLSSEGEETL